MNNFKIPTTIESIIQTSSDHFKRMEISERKADFSKETLKLLRDLKDQLANQLLRNTKDWEALEIVRACFLIYLLLLLH